MEAGRIYVDSDQDGFDSQDDYFDIKIQKNVNYEPEDFHNYDSGDNLAGILQRYGDKARWGNEFFNYGTGNGKSGGSIEATVGTNMVSLITDLQNTGCDTHTPLAEAYYVAMQYFKQEDVADDLDYPNNVIPHSNDGQDPYYNGTEFVYCAKSFVILLTDGASTMDGNIPDFLKDYDNDNNDNTACDESDPINCDYSSGGTDYLDDVALYARTNDLRTDLDGDQNLILYTVYALSDDENARSLLKDAARNGGFEDLNGDGVPNGDYSDQLEDRLEWDEDGDGNPDTYFEASDGYALEQELGEAITDILRRAASGTAVSVISASSEGEGTLVQAYFKPAVSTGTIDTKWVGYLRCLWLDEQGNMREDTNGDKTLNIETDRIVKFIEDNGEIKIERYAVSASDSYPDTSTASPVDTVSMEASSDLWEAGSILSQKYPANRNIFTFIDKDEDGVVDDTSTYDSFDSNGEVVKFHTDVTAIQPYLGVLDNTKWSYLGDTATNRAKNLIHFIRGNDSGFFGITTNMDMRTRNIDGNVWKLGDIVYSTPVMVADPPDDFDLLYGDESYSTYYEAMKDRESMVYVGANDGMLHAFTSWKYDAANTRFVQPSSTSNPIGDELWAFVPQCLLPHLKWLPSSDYTHVNYVDLQPKVFDAKILADDAHYTDTDTDDNWGTIMLLGMNQGGRHIWAEGDYDNDSNVETRHFYPSYVCMDITDPREPVLLWEKTYSVPASPPESSSNDPDLGLTMSYPSIAKVGDKWFAVFGSGPKDYDGNSDRNGHIFVVDLKTGEPYPDGTNDWLFETSEPRAFMASPTTLDKNMNYNVDAAYIGETYDNDSGSGFDWQGAMYKIRIPWVCDATDCSNIAYGDTDNGHYINDPIDETDPTIINWKLSKLFDSPGPVTAAPVLSIDSYENAWIFFGTGRYLSEEDKSNTDQQYIIGLKDPFFNEEHQTTEFFADDYYHNTTSLPLTLYTSDLLEADNYTIIEGGDVYTGVTPTYEGTFSDLKDDAAETDGWYRSLTHSKERVLTKPAIIGGIVLTTSFIPNDDICEFGGDSYLYGFYYETGTAYQEEIFSNGTETISIAGENEEKVLDLMDLGSGLASTTSIHVGKEEGGKAKAFIQKSTGQVLDIEVDPALKIRSGLKAWIERE
jgi:type IV pilus assembly protein PilY1